MSSISNVENLSPQTIRQVIKEMHEISINSPEGIKVQLNDADVTDIQAILDGPAGTPYAGGTFRVKLLLGKDFPSAPPKAYFVTKIFHPNVAANGEICVNTLKKDWKPDLGIKHILLTIKCLLIVPNAESALNEEAGKMLLETYDDYSQRAKMMTEIHAQPFKSLSIKTTSKANNLVNNNKSYGISSENPGGVNGGSGGGVGGVGGGGAGVFGEDDVGDYVGGTGDDGPLSKKHAIDKKLLDKKKEKIIKEKKRILKRL